MKQKFLKFSGSGVNRIYSRSVGFAPISIVNSYYRYRNVERPYAWLTLPFYFIHIPKAAGTSICSSLHMPDPGHLLFKEMKKKTARELAQKRCFMVIRDPLERLVSTYNYATDAWVDRRRHLVGFIGSFNCGEDFLKHIISNPKFRQLYFLRPASLVYQDALDYGARVDILRFENIEHVFPAYMNSLGFPPADLAREKVSRSRSFKREQVSPEIYDKIYEIFSEDQVLRRHAWTP